MNSVTLGQPCKEWLKINLLIKNVEITDAEKKTAGHVLIKDGYIINVISGRKIPPGLEERLIKESIQIIDGKGLTLMPSFVDMHTHLRDPGDTQQEDLVSGQRAALKGGYTSLCTMANTSPCCDSKDIIEYIQTKSKKLNLCDIYQISSLSKGLRGKETVNIDEMLNFTKLFSDDGKTILDEKFMEKSLRLSEEKDFMIMTHSQPEVEIVKRDLNLLKENGGKLHICHISKAKTLQLIKRYKDKGLCFSGEVTPHHLYAYGLNYKVNPPFRTAEDVEALIVGLKRGYIDIIATDHAPHTELDKKHGAPGISSIEIAFSLVNTVFLDYGLDLQFLSRVMSYNPAKLLGRKSGLIKEGFKGDVVLVDPTEKYEIRPTGFLSKGKNSPFAGEIVQGKVKMTIRAGQILYLN